MSKTTVKLKKKNEFHQPYNADWEKLPIFQGWLSAGTESKYKALCKFCNKEFRAHRTDLRTHAQSQKHKKASDNHYLKDVKKQDNADLPTNDDEPKDSEDFDEIADNPSKPISAEVVQQADLQEDTFIPPDLKEPSTKPVVEIVTPRPESPRTAEVVISSEQLTLEKHQDYIISTQVQDMVKGVPVDRLVIHLFAFRDNLWRKFGKGVTDKNGRCTTFIKLHPDDDRIVPGQYKLRYETKVHFTLNLDESVFPFIEVTFDVVDVSEQYEINLLISPYGYMVFKKS